MELLNWESSYLPIDSICDLWNEVIGEEFPLSRRLFLQNSVHCPHIVSKGSWVAVIDNKVIGAIVVKKTGEREELLPTGVGWIQFLIVHPDYRKNGVGTALYEKAERALTELKVSSIRLGGDVLHYFPGIPSPYTTTIDWFIKRGYQTVKHVRDFVTTRPQKPEMADVPEISFTVLEENERDHFLQFLNRCFPGRWEYEAWKYFEQGGNGEHFVVAKRDHSIIGFVRVNEWNSPVIGPNVYWKDALSGKTVGIGPLGIDQRYRKKGYGKAIVQQAIYIAQRRGSKNMVIDWTELDAFYQSFGFVKWREYVQFTKSL